MALFLVAWIAFVSAVDVFFTVKYPPLGQAELNPVGRYVIMTGGIELLVALKTFTTTVVCVFLALTVTNRHTTRQGCRLLNRRIAYLVLLGVSLFQALLLAFLMLA